MLISKVSWEGHRMKTLVKTAGAVFIVLASGMMVSLVYAATQGEDFEWLSTSILGLRIGASGSEGELPPPDAVEFVGGSATVSFLQNGSLVAAGDTLVSAIGDVLAGEGEGEYFEPGAMLLLSQEETTGTAGDASLISLGGDASIFSGAETEPGVLQGSSIRCAADKDVIVQLGGATLNGATGKGNPTKELAAFPTGHRLRAPALRRP